MAIYHLSVTTGSRGGGQSAVAKANYIEREGKYAADAEEVEYRESGNMPEWAADDPQAYWAAADEHERANGSLFKHIEFALPVELDSEQRQELASAFVQELTGGERLPYTLAIHRGEPTNPGEEANPHGHLMISERGLDGHDRDAATWFKRANKAHPERGGALKTRAFMSKEWLEQTRERWADTANRALERHGHADRIDHRTLAAQRDEALQRGQIERAAELSREPGVHLGPENHRKIGGPSRVLEIAERIEQSNTQDRAERDDANGQVDRAALVVQERRAVLTVRLQAIDKEIRATRLAVVKDAARRGLVQLAKTVKTGAKWISAIPERRQERRLQAEREAVRAARREQSTREGAERMAKWEGERKAWEQQNGPMRSLEMTETTPRTTADDHTKQFADEIIKQIEKGEGLTLPEWKGAEITPWQAQANVENVIRASGVPIREVNGDRAYYSMAKDEIVLPLRTQFRRPEFYYQTALHEVGHSTGHPARMNRKSLQQGHADGFRSPAYALEELRTELSTMLSSARLGVAYEPQHGTAYAESWLKTLKDDPQEIYRAVEEAGRISDYVCTAPERDRARSLDTGNDAAVEKAREHQRDIDTRGRAMFVRSLEIPRPEWGTFSEEQRLADAWERRNWREAKKITSDVQQAREADRAKAPDRDYSGRGRW